MEGIDPAFQLLQLFTSIAIEFFVNWTYTS
jgi:hypothetical protein